MEAVPARWARWRDENIGPESPLFCLPSAKYIMSANGPAGKKYDTFMTLHHFRACLEF
jgi:hypothetical protein